MKNYPVKIDILLKPIGLPKCRIGLNNQSQDLIIVEDTWVKFVCNENNQDRIFVEHYGRADSDPTTAIIVQEIKFNDISDYKFLYQGIYYPNYPKHLEGNDAVLFHQNYLSWNGVWQLEFTLPIYTWIHKTLDLGWIYD